jgi:hypothetical protein
MLAVNQYTVLSVTARLNKDYTATDCRGTGKRGTAMSRETKHVVSRTSVSYRQGKDCYKSHRNVMVAHHVNAQ